MEGSVSWFVYVLRCADDTLYTGVAMDVSRRVEEHNTGPRGAAYTRGRRPVRLVASSPPLTKREAYRLEYRVKRLPPHAKIRRLLSGAPHARDHNAREHEV